MNGPEIPVELRPPVNKSMKVLDRSFFKKDAQTTAGTITDSKLISTIRNRLTKSSEALEIPGLKSIVDDETHPGLKCIVFGFGFNPNDQSTWSEYLKSVHDQGLIKLRPYTLKLTYDDWRMHDILEAILPDLPDDEQEIPTGFTQVAHIAHINLRTPYLPYKHLIGEVLKDKNAAVTTVINKTLDVGTESAFRTFPYEVLTGPDDLDVVIRESGCTFRFNFGEVYWNTRLGTEHERLIAKFQPGEAVCDVMAGVGPFAIPAAKKKVWVWANDLNPASYKSLCTAVKENKVEHFVCPSNEDGHAFIKQAAAKLAATQREFEILPPKAKTKRNDKKINGNDSGHTPTEEKEQLPSPPTKTMREPPSFHHFVMNLPASAIEFLGDFKGLLHSREGEFVPVTDRKLPMIHVYTFLSIKDLEIDHEDAVVRQVVEHLGAPITTDLEVFYVRLVAPKKKMYCVSFRLPHEIAFQNPSEQK